MHLKPSKDLAGHQGKEASRRDSLLPLVAFVVEKSFTCHRLQVFPQPHLTARGTALGAGGGVAGPLLEFPPPQLRGQERRPLPPPPTSSPADPRAPPGRPAAGGRAQQEGASREVED